LQPTLDYTQVDYILGELSVANVKSQEISALLHIRKMVPSNLTQPLIGVHSQMGSSFPYWLKQNIIRKANMP
jgi:hypothetical protein